MEKKNIKTLKGIVISDKMQKTAVVAVTRLREHSKYKRRYKITKHYKVHDEKNEYKIGDRVIIQECRPISKNKTWKVVPPQRDPAKGGKNEDLNI